MATEGEYFLAGRAVPELDRLVLRGGRDPPVSRAEQDTVDFPGVATEDHGGCGRVEVPNEDRAFVARRGEPPAPRVEREGVAERRSLCCTVPRKTPSDVPPAASQSRTTPSQPSVATFRPRGSKARANAPPSWPPSTSPARPVSASRNRTVPSSPAVASDRPSGLKATALLLLPCSGNSMTRVARLRIPDDHRTGDLGAGRHPLAVRVESQAEDAPHRLPCEMYSRTTCPVGEVVSRMSACGMISQDPPRRQVDEKPLPEEAGHEPRPVGTEGDPEAPPDRTQGQDRRTASTSQTLTVPSSPQDTSRLPSGLKATDTTIEVWPRKQAISRPVSGSQSRTVPSALAEAMRRPSRLKFTSSIIAEWPRRYCTSRPPAGSQRLIAFSALPTATRPSAGLNATPRLWVPTSRTSASCRPSVASQTRTVLPQFVDVTIRRPSGL